MTTVQDIAKSTDTATEFEPFPIDGVIEGNPDGRVHWLRQQSSGDGVLYTGIFTGQRSKFPYTFSGDETFHVIEGRLTIEVEGIGSVDLEPGDIVSFPKGANSTWTVHEPFKKFFVISG
jgi:uncharacterized cupin superfamily protein